MRTRRGFTLIELLVVIAIIAVLAAILFPVFAKAKEKGKQTKCMSNVKQLSQAMRSYGDDYDGKFAWAYEWKNPNQPNLYAVLKKYISGSKAVFQCPSDLGEIATDGWQNLNGKKYWEVFDTSYNWPGVNYIGAWPHLAGLNMSNPIDPKGGGPKWIWQLPLSKRIMMFDGRPWHNFTRKASWADLKGFTVVAYCDGHSKAMDNGAVLYNLGITGAP